MSSLSFYGGVNEIGGNKVLLEDGYTRFFFDFGTSFAVRGKYFEEYLKPRSGTGLLDLLAMGLLPPLQGIYRDDLAPGEIWSRFESLPSYRQLEVDAVVLSHAHLDHSGYISLLKEDIPVYSTAMTAFIAKAIQDSSTPDFEREVCYSSPRTLKEGYLFTEGPYKQRQFAFVDSFSSTQETKAFWNSSPAESKKIESCEIKAALNRIGSLPFSYWLVDHSIFGAAAFAVKTSQGWVGYSGDLRLHGRGAKLTENFIKDVNALQPSIFICEGTRTGKESYTVTEEEVYDKALKLVKATQGLVIADFGPRNVERLLTFYQVAQETSRALVVLAKDAYLLDAMGLVSADVPKLGVLNDFLIYLELKGRLRPWEKKVRSRYESRLVSAADIRNGASDFLLCFSFWDINELIDIAPKGGLYIYSSSEAWDEEQKYDLGRLSNWLDHFGIRAVGLPRKEMNWEIPEAERGLHASGHASGSELIELIKNISPKVLIPIHTDNPDFFVANLKGTPIKIQLPTHARRMEFSSL